MRNAQLCNPSQETWFICWDDKRSEVKAYSSVEPTGCMDTFWDVVDYYLDEEAWLAVLLKNGINPNSSS